MIRVRGARENNLADLSIDLPVNALTVFCGVSGSGKSSLAFDTLHAEGQRRYLEALAMGRSGPVSLPVAVDTVHGLPPTIALPQRAALPGRRSTVGTLLDVDAVLRVLVSRAGTLHCPVCGRAVVPRTHDEIVDAVLAHEPGTRVTLETRVPEATPAVIDEVERAGFSRLRVDDEVIRIDDLDRRRLGAASEVRIVVDRLKADPDRRGRVADSVRLAAQAGQGVMIVRIDDAETVFVDRPYCWHDELRLPQLEPGLLSAQGSGACPHCDGLGREPHGAECGECEGTRLSAVGRAVRWRAYTMPMLQALPAERLLDVLQSVEAPSEVEAATIADVVPRLVQLDALRLAMLPLGRSAQHLSTSERQRLRLVRQVANPLAGVLYVLDEPAAGLDPQLVDVVAGVLRSLVDLGNTVLAVEHHPAIIEVADHVVEFGPGAGRAGGQVVYQGDVGGLRASRTPTARALENEIVHDPGVAPEPTGQAHLSGQWLHGRALDLALPRGQLVAITGPNGSGKSTALSCLGAALAGEDLPRDAVVTGLEGLTRVAQVDRGAARTARSTPATYVGLWDVLRPLLAATREAKVRGFNAGTFSLNTKGGRCAACKGVGQQRVDMGPLPDVLLPCPICDGRRFEADVLEVRWKGHDPASLLGLEASQARIAMAGHPDLDRILGSMVRVGLGYVPLGQPSSTLSGGEGMRLALAKELARASKRGAADTVYLLDDPSVGLHPDDVGQLIGLLGELRAEGATVWLATSDPLVVAASDAIVTLPPPVDFVGD